MPFRSKLGNKIAKRIFKKLIGIEISDTQSGLRAYNKDLMKLFLSTQGERYEYETEMLIDCKKHNINIQEVSIKTIYLNKNKTSYFRPIKDSLKIYKALLKYNRN